MSFSASPYISFPGNAADAFTYYSKLFGGELSLTTYGDMPEMAGMPFTPPPAAVAHAVLTAPGLTLSGGDGIGENLPSLSSDVYSFVLTIDTEDEARALIDRVVSGGGEIAMPFERAPWGEFYGQVTDRFGILWAFNVPGEQG